MRDTLLPGMGPWAAPSRAPEELRLFYATNATNLLGILGSGLVRPKSGWPKFTPDFQEAVPGYIPLFVGGAPLEQLDCVTRHDPNDLPVLIEFHAALWRGDRVLGLDAAGQPQSVSLPTIPAGVQVLLVQGAVPLADAGPVYFGSKEAATRFESYCFTMSNTRADLLMRVHSFSQVANIHFQPPVAPLIPEGADQANSMVAMRRADAMGGILAALLNATSNAGAAIIRRQFPQWRIPSAKRNVDAGNLAPEVVRVIESWIRDERRQTDDPEALLLSVTLDYLVKLQRGAGLAPEALLDHVAKQAAPTSAERQAALHERLQAIRASVLQDQDPGVVLAQGSPVLHGLLLFLLDSEYRDERVPPSGCNPTPDALLMADILRGALNGWSRLPTSLRGEPQAELAVGYAMARLANRLPGSVQFPERAFAWADDESELAAILAEVARALTEKIDLRGLRQIAHDRHAQRIEVQIKAGPGKRGATRKLVRTIKTTGRKVKSAVLRIALDLPWA